MASLQFSSLVQTRRSLSPTGPKLRDSCKSCSASKIKCTKEKPECMRCAKRGMACEYLESKCARRKPGTRPRNRETITMIAHNSPTTTTSSTSPSPCEAERLETRVTTHPSPKTHHPLSFVDILSWTPSLPDPVIATPTGLDYNFDDFLASPISASLLGVPETGDLSAHLMTDFCQLKDFIHAPEVPNLTSSQVAAGEDKTATSERHLPASVPRPQTSTSHLSMSEAPDIGSSCCSISQTLALLTYFPASSSPMACLSSAYGGPGQDDPPTIKSVVSSNDRIVQAINDILQCRCSEDGYLLAILSVVILKVLGWYATIIRQLPGFEANNPGGEGPTMRTDSLGEVQNSSPPYSEPSQRASSGAMGPSPYRGEGEEQTRMAAQLVLSQLHRVQRLVNILCHRFTLHGDREGNPSWTPSTMSTTTGSDRPAHMESLYPFPNLLFEHVEKDVRKRLRSLSAELLEMLRY